MANTDNECADLKIDDLYSKSTDTLGDIMNLQKDTQESTYDFNFENMNLREVMNFWHVNTHSLVDEIHEATDALGGIKDGSGNAVWKYWKKDFTKYDTLKFGDLSKSDQIECKFEIVDMLHFFMNYAISIGMTSSEMFNMFMSKNKENRDRQKRGY
tara:strand:- start:20695 stop:21162 length:468 start_codon:yes stop_codon:yes gene_type:complete